MKLSALPNLITGLRILLTIPVGWAMYHQHFELALVLFAVAGISDGVDGFLAKHFGWVSRIGGFLDPLADKLLLTVAFVMLGYLGLLPLWLVVATVVRDVVITCGALYYHFRIERLVAEPRIISKAHTAFQIVLGLLAVFSAAYGQVPLWLIDTGVLLVGLTTVASVVDYIWIWSRRAARRAGSAG